MAQLVKCLPSKQEDPNLIPQNPWEKAWDGATGLEDWRWGGRDKRILGSFWPAKLVTSSVSQGTHQKRQRERDQGRHPAIASGVAFIHMCAFEYTRSAIHTQINILS